MPKSTRRSVVPPNPPEILFSYSKRLAILSLKQKALLDYFVTNGLSGEIISISVISTNFPEFSIGETLYRLEHLRFLGFIDHVKLDTESSDDEYGNFAFTTTSAYRTELGGDDMKEYLYVHGDIKQTNIFLGSELISDPPFLIGDFGDIPTQPAINSLTLLEQFSAAFSLDEMRSISFGLKIDDENIPSETKFTYARELIKYLKRRHRLKELTDMCNLQRPDLNWNI